MGVRMLLLDGKLIPLLCRRQKERKGGSTRRVSSDNNIDTMEGSNKVMQVVLVILLLMKSVMPSLEPQDMPNEEVEKVSSLSRSPLFYKATMKDLCCIHLSLGFPKHCSRNGLLAFPDTTSGTHFYFDNECLTGQSFLAAFTSSKNGDVQKIETVALAELNNYVRNSPPQSGGPNNTSSSNFCSRESSDAQEDPLHLRDPTQEFMCYKQRLRSH
ncbi:hypothetical protein Bca4012_073596 [Brassica carinata]